MSGSVSYSCVRNCHPTFAIPQNLCMLGTAAAIWYEEGISKLVSWYDKCLSVQGEYVEKWVKVCDKTCLFCFFPIINKYLCMAKRSLFSERPSYFSLSLCFSTYQYYVNVIFFTSEQGTYFTFHSLTHPTSFQILTLNYAFLILSFILLQCNIPSFPTQLLFPSMHTNAPFLSHSLSSYVLESSCTVV